MIKNRIWSSLVNTKFKCFYIQYLTERYHRNNLAIRIFLAIVSLSSVAAWAIWDIIPWLWTIIIAASNILQAINPLLAFEKKVKVLIEKLSLLEDIQMEFEELYYKFMTNKIDEQDASDKFFELHKKHVKSLQCSTDNMFSENKRIKIKSKENTFTYLKAHYNI